MQGEFDGLKITNINHKVNKNICAWRIEQRAEREKRYAPCALRSAKIGEHMSTEAKCPVMHGSVTNAAAPTNSGWWPNQLSLKSLHQNSSLSNPMGPAFEYAEAVLGGPEVPGVGVHFEYGK
jgi:hypothetical protein